MEYPDPKIWALSNNEEFADYIRGLVGSEEYQVRWFKNISEILSLEEPEEGIILAINSFGKFSNYMPVIRRFQKNFVSYDIVVFGEINGRERMEEEYMEGVDLHVTPEKEREEISASLRRMAKLRSIKSVHGIIGRSQQFNHIIDKVVQVSPTEVSVLLEGESGTGKEVIARTMHYMSGRKGARFEEVNCGALAEGVLESELFGHEKGSFTGAVGRRKGLFERADGGTVFLDEVGEMPLGMQVKLLRVLETGDFLRVGGIERIHSDVRIIAASNKDISVEVEKGAFRRDLYYRLKVVQIKIPPLRMRKEDIILFVNVFLKKSSKRHGKKIRGVEKDGYRLLAQYPWPGNVRELMNVIDNLVVFSDSSFISAEEIGARLREESGKKAFPDLPVKVEQSREEMERELIMNSLISLNNDMKEALRLLRDISDSSAMNFERWVEVQEEKEDKCKDLSTIEKEAIKEALLMNGGNRRKAAQQLGMSERTLYRRLNDYGIS